jgi:hypothetical protein
METNTLKTGTPTMIVAQERKMVWNRLWNPLPLLPKGVATTCFHDNYPGTWSMESQRTFECTHSSDGNKYNQNWYSNKDCGTTKKDDLEQVVEFYSTSAQGGCHNLFTGQLSQNRVHGIIKDL